jgi:RNA polymerase sigma factor (sigma-70 family)
VIVEANMGLVGSCISKRAPRWLLALYGYKEAYQVCSVALIRAVQGFDGRSTLGSYAEECMMNALLQEAPKQKAVVVKRSDGKLYQSVEALDQDVEEPDDSVLAFRKVAVDAVQSLDTIARRVAELMLDGHTMESMVRTLGVSRATVFRARDRVVRRLKTIFS